LPCFKFMDFHRPVHQAPVCTSTFSVSEQVMPFNKMDMRKLRRWTCTEASKATLILFVGLQLLHPQNHMCVGGIKIKSQNMLFWAYYDVVRDADFWSSDKDKRKYFKHRSLTMFYCNIAWNIHKITLLWQYTHLIQA
jgi:hypothetical protein